MRHIADCDFARALLLFPLATALLAMPVAARTAGIGDVLVVDPAGGTGSDYPSLLLALTAASDGDTILVRTGTFFDALVVNGKSIVIQAEAGAQVLIHNSIQIQNIGSGQSVTLRGIDGHAPNLGSNLVVSNCQGVVSIEDAEYFGSSNFVFPGGGVAISNCASVSLVRSTMHAFEHQFLNPGLDVTSSSVTLFDCLIEGVKGFDQAGPPNPGSYGVRLSQSALVASFSTLVGGAGGDYVGAPESCSDGGTGGVGLSLFGGSIASLFGTSVLGGPGGTSNGACLQGPTGAPLLVDPSSSLLQSASELGGLSASSPVREGATFDLTLRGEPFSPAWALYASSPFSALSSPLFDGRLLVSVQPFLFVALGNLPASGATTLTFPFGNLPVGVEGQAIYTQLLTLAPSDGRLRLGAPSLLLLLDSGL